MSHGCHRFWKCYKTRTFFLTFDKVQNPLRLPRKTTSERPKMLWTRRNVLCATTACTFSSLIWPDGSAPAALASLLFDPAEPQIIGKHSEPRLFYLFVHLHLLSSGSFSSLILSLLLFSDPSLLLFSSLLWLFPPLLFHLSILSEVWLLNLLRQID